MFFVTDEEEPEGNLLKECRKDVIILETSVARCESQFLPETALNEDDTSDNDLDYGK